MSRGKLASWDLRWRPPLASKVRTILVLVLGWRWLDLSWLKSDWWMEVGGVSMKCWMVFGEEPKKWSLEWDQYDLWDPERRTLCETKVLLDQAYWSIGFERERGREDEKLYNTFNHCHGGILFIMDLAIWLSTLFYQCLYCVLFHIWLFFYIICPSMMLVCSAIFVAPIWGGTYPQHDLVLFVLDIINSYWY